MPNRDHQRRVLVTGATGFLGFRVVVALLEAGVQVSVLIKPEQTDKLAAIADRVRIVHGDIWNRASLKGQGRGHSTLVHLVGSMKADAGRGLTHQHLNLVPARNAVGMAVSDGIQYFTLLSTAALPGSVSGQYLRNKRESEEYLINSGLEPIIIRAPFLYVPSFGSLLMRLQAFFAVMPPSRWLIGRYMPLSADVAARGIAAAVIDAPRFSERILYANDLRWLARQSKLRQTLDIRPAMLSRQRDQEALEEVPFGWLPPPPRRK